MTIVASAYVDLRPSTARLPHRARRRIRLALSWFVVGLLDIAEAIEKAVWRWTQREIVFMLDTLEWLAYPFLPRSPGRHRAGYPSTILVLALQSGVDPATMIGVRAAYPSWVASGSGKG